MTRRILIALGLLALAGVAEARTLTDQYGATVTVSPDGATYTVTRADGFSATVKPLVLGDDAAALRTINAMCSGPASVCSPPLPANPVITKAVFLKRFTAAELTAISGASRTNDAINVWLITAQSYDTIDLSDPLTKQGLDALVAAGLLTAIRETMILTP